MRIAVALPSLSAGSLQRIGMDDAILGLAHRGHDVEAFAEAARTREPQEVPVYHYLRMRERHHAARFDAALYPLGRDTPPYEPAYVLMHQFPGVAWVLDPVLHHLAIGGIALRGRWDSYQDLLEQTGVERARDVASAVAGGWGVRSLYRRCDPIPALLARQRRVCASTPYLAGELSCPGAPTEVVPMPRVPTEREPFAAESGHVRRILVMTINYAWPEPAFAALAELLDAHADVVVRVVAPELVYQVSLAHRAAQVGLRTRVEWILSPDWSRLATELERADAVVHLRDDPTAGEQAILLAALGAGVPVVVLRVGAQEHLPEGAVLKIEPGRSLTQSLVGMLGGLLERPDLVSSVSKQGAAFHSRQPGPEEVAAMLEEQLDGGAGHGLIERSVSASCWEELARALERACIPAATAPGDRSRLMSHLGRQLPAAARE